MHIKRIEIDGFKSYAQKVVIDNFDLQFNAITGLNGSGKSNILDSICFVLGIQDLKLVRAENMNALVYKSGQAGITKASVTITFDNRDKKNGPIGYIDYDEIIVKRTVIVNGRSSYTINGAAMTNNKVYDFFRSVGLNVNIPHFLIMQGRITKVLNMKPNEILELVEEGAGTKMYDSKRALAVAHMEKKQRKFEEIHNLLHNDIEPSVERLKSEKEDFFIYQKLCRDVDVTKKQLDAYDYWQYLKDADTLKEQATEIETTVVQKEETKNKLRMEETEIISKIAELESKKSLKASDEQKSFQDNLAKAKEGRVEAESDRDTINQQLTEAQSEIDRINEESAREQLNVDETKRKLAECEKNYGGEEKRGKDAQKVMATAKAKLEALAKGLSTDDDGQAVTLEAQITNARTTLADHETKVKTAQLRYDKIKPELTKKRKVLDEYGKQASSDMLELEQYDKKVTNLKKLRENCKFDPVHYDKLSDKLRHLIVQIKNLESQIGSFTEKEHRLGFHYDKRRIWAGFDEETEIVGPVISLFKMKDMAFAQAIFTISSSQLFNVVFAHQQTAAAFVDQNLMLQRKTIIPMDRLQGKDFANFENRIAVAKKICDDWGEDMHLALDLLEYDPKYQKVMEQIFSGVIVVKNARLASEIAYNAEVRLRVVTTDGDDMRPQGAMHGGFDKNHRDCAIVTVNGYYDVLSENKRCVKEKMQIESELNLLQSNRDEYDDIKYQLDAASGRLETLRENLKNSSLQILKDEIANMEEELPQCEAVLQESQQKMKELHGKIKELEDRKKNEKEYQDRERKKYEKEYKDAEKIYKNCKSSFDNASDKLERLRKEVEKGEATKTQLDDEVNMLQLRKEELSKELNTKEKAVQAAFTVENDRQEELDKFMLELKQKDMQIKKARSNEDTIKKSIREAENDIINLQRQYKKCKDDAEECRRLAAHLKKNCKTIADIESSLGKEGDYSFKGFDKKKVLEKYEKMKADIENMSKNINPKAHAILDNAQSKVDDLKAKTNQIEKDRSTLNQTIDTLDSKKRQELIRAHEQVNRDFGNIFSTLLRGTSAKLEPPPGKTVLDGLEVKVAFNGQWKDSLNELSGGQRSLVALSLILAMLKFKPAPIYILDEIDSALDLSHTQNIGTMIKNYFTNSQFIIVSLKEGMFGNANVIYRVRFVDGTSQVIRERGKAIADVPAEGNTEDTMVIKKRKAR